MSAMHIDINDIFGIILFTIPFIYYSFLNVDLSIAVPLRLVCVPFWPMIGKSWCFRSISRWLFKV